MAHLIPIYIDIKYLATAQAATLETFLKSLGLGQDLEGRSK